MKLIPTSEADSVNVQVPNVGQIVAGVSGINPTELSNKVAENGYSLHVVDTPEQQTTGSLLPFTVLTDIRSLQYHTYHRKGQRPAVLTVTSDE